MTTLPQLINKHDSDAGKNRTTVPSVPNTISVTCGHERSTPIVVFDFLLVFCHDLRPIWSSCKPFTSAKPEKQEDGECREVSTEAFLLRDAEERIG